MPDQPLTGVEQDAAIQKRMENFLTQPQGQAPEEVEQTPEPAPAEAEQPEGQVTEELTPEDLEPTPEPQAQPAVETEFEIVHEGQQRKLSRAETIQYAQQGFDYTKKTQAVAEKDKAVTQALQRLTQLEQSAPAIAQELGQVKALEVQLDGYKNINWVELARSDPQNYPAYRAQYETLRDSYAQASVQFNQRYSGYKQQLSQVTAQRLQQEEARLPDFIPEWKDPAKRDSGKAAIVKFLTDLGADPETAGQKLNDALSISIVNDAMRYRQLLKSKGEKVKQLRTAPPVTRPGAIAPTAQADKTEKLTKQLRRSGSVEDAAALLLNRLK